MENNTKKFVPGDIVRFAEAWCRDEEKDQLSIVKECYNDVQRAYIEPLECTMYFVPVSCVTYEMIELVTESPFRSAPLYGEMRYAGRSIIWKQEPGSDSNEKTYLVSAARGKCEWSRDPDQAKKLSPKQYVEILNKLREAK